MRVKKLLTAALCAVLAIVSCNMSSALGEKKLNIENSVVYAAETDMTASGQAESSADTSSGNDEISTVSENPPQKPTESQEQKPTESQTSTESQTQKPTESQTQKPTESQEQKPTESQTQKPTESQEQKPTESQTQKPTEGQTSTESQTQKPTESQTQKPTEGQTSTESQTQKPTEGQTSTEGQTQKPTEGQTSTEGQTQKPTEGQTSTEGQTQKPTEGQTSTEGQTQKPTEGQTSTEVQTEHQSSAGNGTESSESTGTEQFPSETTPGTEGTTETFGTEVQLPGETVMTETVSEEELELETEKKKKKKKKETESESESETSLYGSNEELIRHQNIVRPPEIQLEFRFTQIEPEYAIVQNHEGTSVYESRSEEAEVVGELAYYGICCVLEDCGDGWYYIESRNVRGFAKAEEFATGDVAQRVVNVKGLEELPEARLLIARTENSAYDYTHTTVQEVLADKVYALADEEEVKIYEQRKASSDVAGVLAEGALCYILADEEKDWVYVESGNARGFVEKEKLITGKKAEKAVKKAGENNMALADVKIDPEDNEACYYTLTSVKKASESAKLREEMVSYALDYLGNPYVWGGTSLTNGADCSGFVQSVYAHFGYSLPRVAEAQSGYGMQIPVDSAAPGDLIFYARNGYVYHVSMYIGNGQVVHAAGRTVGIITSGIDGSAVWATRIISD